MAAATGVTLDLPTDYTHHVDNKKPEYTSKFISGKIPALEDKDGFTLFEGVVIARYSEFQSFDGGGNRSKRHTIRAFSDSHANQLISQSHHWIPTEFSYQPMARKQHMSTNGFTLPNWK